MSPTVCLSRKRYQMFVFTVFVLVSFLPDAGAQQADAQQANAQQADALQVGAHDAQQADAQQADAQQANAQQAGVQQKADYDYTQKFDTYGRYIPSRSANDQSGKVGIIESESEYDYQFKAFGKLPVELSVDSQYIGINNSTSVFLPAHLTGFTTGIETTIPFFGLDKTYFHAGVFPSFLGDNWTFSSANFRIPSRYYAIYKYNDQLVLVAGVAVFPDYDTTVSPVLGVIYKPNDQLTFYFVTDKQNISYALTDRFTLFVEAGERTDDEYIFTENTVKNAVLRYTEDHLGTGVKFKINKYANLVLSGGEVFGNAFKYLNTGGKVDLKNGPYVELKVEVKI